MKNFVFVLFLTLSVACANQLDDPRPSDDLLLEESVTPNRVLSERAKGLTVSLRGAGSAATSDSYSAAQQDATQTQKLIKTGNIRFRSTDIESDYASIVDLLPAAKAYIEYQNQSKDNRQINYTMTIRVEADKFDQLYQSIVGISDDVLDKSTNVQDVTERFYDLETRIKNKKALEVRYLALLERATKMNDILQIERSLNDARTDIERMQGQFNYLKKQIGFSTISLSFFEVLPYSTPTTEQATFGSRILASLNRGWEGILSFIISAVSLWPVLLLAPVAIFVFVKMRGRRVEDD